MGVKNIIISFGSLGLGGAQRRAATIANYLVKEGFNVTIVSLTDKAVIDSEENFYDLKEQVSIVILPEFISKSSDRRIHKQLRREEAKVKLLKKITYFLSLFKIDYSSITHRINTINKGKFFRSFLSLHKQDGIIHFGFLTYTITDYAKWKNKCIYAETNSMAKYSNDKEFGYIERRLKHANAMVFQTKQEIWEHNLQNNSKAIVIYNPIKPDLPVPFCGERQHIITNYCALKPQKNLMLLLKSFKRLSDEFSDFKLLLYVIDNNNKNKQYENELQSFIDSNKLNNKISLLPIRKDIHETIKDYYMFVSSSDFEGISNSMIEAMAIGLPVICTDCLGGGAREFIDSGQNGLLVRRNDEADLYSAMKRFILDRNLADRCSKNAVNIKKVLSEERILEQWKKIIFEVL